jgi:hypothetical protein
MSFKVEDRLIVVQTQEYLYKSEHRLSWMLRRVVCLGLDLYTSRFFLVKFLTGFFVICFEF